MARGIYKIINTVNNKFYVGSAVNLSRRRTRHFSELRTKRHNNAKLQASWNKYGEAAFIFVVVEELPEAADLLAAEDRWLAAHVGKDYCYNIGVTATAPHLGMSGPLSPSWGRKHTEDAKQRISAASKARTQSEDEKKKRRTSMKGHIVPTAVRAKISATLSGEGNFWYGKKRPDHGAKVSRSVEAIEPDGTVTVYPSISVLRAALDLKPPTVNRALKSGTPITRGKFTGWVFKYVDQTQNTVA
jgi:group I intron endonuclease